MAFSQPFAKIRAVFTYELKDKGGNTVKGFMGSMIKLKILDIGLILEQVPILIQPAKCLQVELMTLKNAWWESIHLQVFL